MIEEHHNGRINRTNKIVDELKSLRLLADDNADSIVLNGKAIVVEQDADYYYNELIDAYTTNIPKDPLGVMNGLGHQTSLRVSARTEEAIRKLKELHRQDLIDKFEDFKKTLEDDKKNKAEKSFKDAIGQIIDLPKINPEILPYLINVEKRLQKLEGKE